MAKRRKPVETKREETGAVIKRGRHLIKVALVYPNTYQAGMSSLGYQTVYHLANQVDTVACERVFLPDPKSRDREIKSQETGLRLNQFDLILFSISFENDFFNLVRILTDAGIPLRSSKRNHNHHPLVVAGGVACFLNPEPLAPFMDLFLLGEAEPFLADFFKLFADTDRATLLQTVESELPGAYVPATREPILYPREGETPAPKPAQPPVQVQYLEHLEETLTCSRILASQAAFKDTFLIETLKGCPHGCRFCTAGFIYRPPRIYPVETILSAMDEAAAQTHKVGLVSSAVLDHPEIHTICSHGRDLGLTLSFSSLRAAKLDEKILDLMAQGNVKTATIAPEAGSDRMRRIINKKLVREDILAAARKLVDNGIINLKLYFMVGLPFEQREDVQAIVDLAQDIKAVFLEASRAKKKIGTITLSVNPFIPKPCTPFQWAPMMDKKELEFRLNLIKNGMKKTANVKVQTESLKKARINALLSLGDRRCADILEAALDKGWSPAMREYKSYVQEVVETEKSLEAPLPWDVLNHRITDKFLRREYEKARIEKQSRACPMKACHRCGICMEIPSPSGS